MTITVSDILPFGEYAKIRSEERRRLIGIKRHRRMHVGPLATFYFENRDTLLYQIHEMLHVDRGGPGQVEDELAAYNPLVPNGRELVATLMIEIDDPVRRRRVLAGLGGVEETVGIGIGRRHIRGQAEEDVDRTTADGKASSVHFLHFPMTEDDVRAFRNPDETVILGISHSAYQHAGVMPAKVRAALAGDLE